MKKSVAELTLIMLVLSLTIALFDDGKHWFSAGEPRTPLINAVVSYLERH